MPKGLTRGELARRVGVRPSTIRYYEQQGLLPAPARTARGYRIYTEDDVVRLRFIRRAQALGFSLRTIRELLQLEASGEQAAEVARAQALRHLQEVRRRLRDLQRLEAVLARLVAACAARRGEGCPILQALQGTDPLPYDSDSSEAGVSASGTALR
ncbi:MerR family transcriptional regulator [Rhodothermus marinus]|jgi:MerR family mercuric resistance operon transcriptional regulator|uniref:MerR family transcriptional regulator n=1 Tax=Rhodothermus marinus TaxID=29549 RepID=UPI001FB48DA0|nr:MerR family transcriptional regulator [Rhodothermus marinus]